MLHVTNGDAAAGALRVAGLEGARLPWCDVLHEGPLPAAPDDAALRRARAAFLAGTGLAPDAVGVEADLADRDLRLARALAAHEPVTLWFEHDLYDQWQLVQVLARCAPAIADGAPVELVLTSDYIGPMTPDAVRAAWESRRAATDDDVALATAAWAALRAPGPGPLAAIARDDAHALPHLGAAARRHLEELPSRADGLSRSERQALEAIAAGHDTLVDAFVHSHSAREPALFLGDTVFIHYLERLSACRVPLVTFTGGALVRLPRGDTPPRGWWQQRVALTAAGRDALAGTADHVRLNAVERWLGGIHLGCGYEDWRWDATREAPVTGLA
ncbi:MAG: DUF1835 domain-containing protein [Gemmatimonadetes bacterium]|nr:DUF1835 domain-containing protein [Gemmatimonadota bacterium]